MKRLACSALPAAMLIALAGCDSPSEQQAAVEKEAMQEGDVNAQAEEMEAQARALRSGDLEAREDAIQAEQDQVENAADGT